MNFKICMEGIKHLAGDTRKFYERVLADIKLWDGTKCKNQLARCIQDSHGSAVLPDGMLGATITASIEHLGISLG